MRLVLAAQRIAADWLAHPTHGVNACIARLPIDVGDTRPALITGVRDATRDGRTARGQLPSADSRDAGRYVRVFHHAPLNADGEVMATVRGGRVPLGISYEMRGDATDVDYVGALYVIDAIANALTRLSDPRYATENVAAKLRLGCQWVGCETLLVGVIRNPAADTTTLASLVIEPQFEDTIADTL